MSKTLSRKAAAHRETEAAWKRTREREAKQKDEAHRLAQAFREIRWRKKIWQRAGNADACILVQSDATHYQTKGVQSQRMTHVMHSLTIAD